MGPKGCGGDGGNVKEGMSRTCRATEAVGVSDLLQEFRKMSMISGCLPADEVGASIASCTDVGRRTGMVGTMGGWGWQGCGAPSVFSSEACDVVPRLAVFERTSQGECHLTFLNFEGSSASNCCHSRVFRLAARSILTSVVSTAGNGVDQRVAPTP